MAHRRPEGTFGDPLARESRRSRCFQIPACTPYREIHIQDATRAKGGALATRVSPRLDAASFQGRRALEPGRICLNGAIVCTLVTKARRASCRLNALPRLRIFSKESRANQRHCRQGGRRTPMYDAMSSRQSARLELVSARRKAGGARRSRVTGGLDEAEAGRCCVVSCFSVTRRSRIPI